MKTLILYATKYGAAAEVARRIASKIGDAVTHDLKQGGIPGLAGFDCVIVGSSAYAGMIRKEAKIFMSQNARALRGKPLGLFISGMAASEAQSCFEANFPPDILQAAKATTFPGGVFDPKKAGAMERLVMRAVSKQSGYIDSIDDNKIARFAQEMKA